MVPIFWIIVILGVVEGITEFLPISSTGHLILVKHWLSYTGTTADSLIVVIQSGAILAVVWEYRQSFLGLLRHQPGNSFSGWPGCWRLLLTTVPALALGFLGHKWIKHHLFSPTTVACALIVGGLALILIERKPRSPKWDTLQAVTPRLALWVGLCQCLALWPGFSRSAATILGGMWQGMHRKLAAEYSFFAAVPVLIAAAGYDLYKSLPLLTRGDAGYMLLGGAISFGVALVAIRLFIRYVATSTLAGFGYYRIVLGIGVLLLLR